MFLAHTNALYRYPGEIHRDLFCEMKVWCIIILCGDLVQWLISWCAGVWCLLVINHVTLQQWYSMSDHEQMNLSLPESNWWLIKLNIFITWMITKTGVHNVSLFLYIKQASQNIFPLNDTKIARTFYFELFGYIYV